MTEAADAAQYVPDFRGAADTAPRPGGWEKAMIVVTGSVTAREDSFDEILRLSQEHVNRSRTEPGCIAHAVHVDCENRLRLVFFERWADRDALRKHFAVPASRELVRSLQTLAAGPATLELFDANKIEKL